MTTPSNKTVWHTNTVKDKDGNFLSPKLLPYKVIFEGIQEGCSLPTLIVIEPSTGMRINTSLDFYHQTEEDAWDSIQDEVNNEVFDLEQEIESLRKELALLEKYQEDLGTFREDYFKGKNL